MKSKVLVTRLIACAALLSAPAIALAETCELPADGAASRSLLVACKGDVADTEADLDKTYRRVRAQTPMELRTQLGKAQQAWLLYRASQCLLEAGGPTGAGGVAALACTAAMNRDRIAKLDEALMRGE